VAADAVVADTVPAKVRTAVAVTTQRQRTFMGDPLPIGCDGRRAAEVVVA
jgi:hypothetical protein